MNAFWEAKFSNEKTLWGFEPSDAAICTKDFFLEKDIHSILIPGCGYGRNAKIFHESGMDVTGIEISRAAIDFARTENNLDITIHHGSVTDMPFDKNTFDGIFCYALIHLLNKRERKTFLQKCYAQLNPNGYMFFSVVSKKAPMYGKGRKVSEDRFEVMDGLTVFFYDDETVQREFKDYGLIDFHEMDEPIKHMPEDPALRMFLVKCRKMKADA